MVFDDVRNAADLTRHLPSSSNGRIIVTTQDQGIAELLRSTSLYIDHWDLGSGYAFFCNLLSKSIDRDARADIASAFSIAARLDGHALTTSHIAALLREEDLTVDRFIQMLQDERQVQPLKRQIDALWTCSIQYLKIHHPDSFALLGIMAFLMPDRIPDTLFSCQPTAGRALPVFLASNVSWVSS